MNWEQLLVTDRVSGYNRLPEPPAKIIPFLINYFPKLCLIKVFIVIFIPFFEFSGWFPPTIFFYLCTIDCISSIMTQPVRHKINVLVIVII